MKPLTKNSAYAYLNRIKTESNGKINISPYMHKVAENEIVPTEVLIFINRHIGLPQLYTYNEIWNKMRKNPLYNNLVNEDLDDEGKAIALSSLVTHTFIHRKHLVEENKIEDISEYTEIMNIDAITEALSDFANGDNRKLNRVFMETRELMKQLYGGRKRVKS